MSINRTQRKGQTLAPDFITAISLFGVVLVFGMTMFASTYYNNAEFEQFEDVQRQSIDVLDTIVRTGGSPNNWTNETVTIVGLANEDHVLDGEKLLELSSISTERLRDMFGLGQHSFYLTIENKTDIIVYNNTLLAYGTPVAPDADHIIYTVRYASLTIEGNRTTVSLKFKVWN